MHRALLSLVLAVLAMLVLLLGSMHWWAQACFPFETRTFKWQCELGIPLVALSFAVPGFVYGILAAESPWIQGSTAALVASVVASAMSYFHPLFGGTLSTNLTSALFYAVFPGLLATLAGYRLRPLLSQSAA